MLNAYERQLILFYLCNAASHFHHASPETRELADWVFENYDLLELEGENKKLGEHRANRHDEKEVSAREWQRLRKTLKNEYSAACEGAQEDSTARRLRQLGREMDLASEDIAVLEIMLRSHRQPIIDTDLPFYCPNVIVSQFPLFLGSDLCGFLIQIGFKKAKPPSLLRSAACALRP